MCQLFALLRPALASGRALGPPTGKREEHVVLPSSNFSMGQAVQPADGEASARPCGLFSAISLAKAASRHGRACSEILTNVLVPP